MSMRKNERRLVYFKVQAILSSFLIFCWASVIPVPAAATFDGAARTYLDGDYEKAASLFESLAKAEPKNARIQYYLGLSYMRLKEREKAGNAFEAADSLTNDEALKLIAQTWLFRLDRHRKKISDNYSVARPEVAKEHGPVTKVFWFYTNWCPKCKLFKTSFETAKEKFKTVRFTSMNAEDPKNWNLVAKYKVKAYPTLVYFDGKDKVIENYAAAPMGNTFEHHLSDLGAKK